MLTGLTPNAAGRRNEPGRKGPGLGDVVGHYRLERRLGAGGMGVVFEATDTDSGQRVALKLLRDPCPEAIAAFKREFRSLADVAHPNLASLYELGVARQCWYLTMELVDGVDFLTWIDGHVGRLRNATRLLADAIGALHRAGVVHRDIKPSNVLVDRHGRVVVLDFGLAAELGRAATDEGATVLGTVNYIAPERVRSRGRLSPASDWYSVGVMLYQALTGELPFVGGVHDILHDKVTSDPLPPRELAPEAPADLAVLAMLLLARDPGERGDGGDILACLGRRSGDRARRRSDHPPPLLGRDPHIEELESAALAVTSGAPVCTLVRGASGMGKTSLLRAFRAGIAAAGAVVLSGRCYEREAVPYKGLDMVVDDLVRYLVDQGGSALRRLVSPELASAVRLFPQLTTLDRVADHADDDALRGAIDGEHDRPRLRERGFAALRGLLHRVAGRTLVVVSIDDAQWIDHDGANLILELCRPPHSPRLLLLLGFRTGEEHAASPLGALVRGLRAHADVDPPGPELRELDVGALGDIDAARLAAVLTGGDVDARARAIAREAGGNPWLVGELARYAIDHRDQPATAGEVPTIEDAVAARIDRLPPSARPLVEVLAVAGHPLTPGCAIEAAGAALDAEAALAALRAACLIRYRSARGVETVEPYHDRVRETVVARLDEARVRRIHAAIAGVLERRGGDVELLAIHAWHAGDPRRAARYTLIAAERAAGQLAFDRAARFYRAALELAGGAPELRLLRGLADALAHAGRSRDAAETYTRAAALCDGVAALELRRRAADQLLRSGRIDDGIGAARDVLADVAVTLAPTMRRALIGGMARRAWVRTRGFRHRPRRADEVAPRDLVRVDTLYSVATGLAMIDPVRAMDLQAKHMLAALRVGEPYRVARALASHVAPVAARGTKKAARAQRLLAVARAAAEASGHPHALALVDLVAGYAAYGRGAWSEARGLFERSDEVFERQCIGAGWEVATCRFFSLVNLFRGGQLHELRGRALEWVAAARQHRDLHALTNLEMAASYARLAADDPAEARVAIDEAASHWQRASVPIREYRAHFMKGQIDVYEGNGAAAYYPVAEAWDNMKRSFLLRVEEVQIGMRALRARTAVARAACSRVDEAERDRLLAAALADARALDRLAPYARARAATVRAAVAWARGEADDAVLHLLRAENGYETNEMAAYAAAARLCRGAILGTGGGVPVAAAAETELRALGAKNPGRFAAFLCFAV